jgi:hypothetical protein
LTVGVVGYITFVYLRYYSIILYEIDPIIAIIQVGIFVCFPILIFWALGALLTQDPGFVTKKFIAAKLEE